MTCRVCNKVPNSMESDDCLEKALDAIKEHYSYYKNALKQRDLELQQVKDRNEKLYKALQLLQKNQHPSKRFKSSQSEATWLGNNFNNSSKEERILSDASFTDDESVGASNLNIALNSEQLFNTSALSQTKSAACMTTCSEKVQSPHSKQCAKKKKKKEEICYLEKSKSEWHTKERDGPVEKSWAMQFLQPPKTKTFEEKLCGEGKKTADKRLCLSLKKTNPSKVKQSLLTFTKSKDSSCRESDIGEDIIEASPVIVKKYSKTNRSWSHRSGNNYNISSSNTTNAITKKDDTNKTVDDIVFDFSPSKKTDLDMSLNSPKETAPKELKYYSDISKDCMSLSNDKLKNSSNKSDASSVVILTPGTQDIIFVDDTCNSEAEIDTMDLLANIMQQKSTDNFEQLKKYENKCLQNQHKEIGLFKKPLNLPQNDEKTVTLAKIKSEKITQENVQEKENIQISGKEKTVCNRNNHISHIKTTKSLNPLLSSFDQHDTEEDEDFMPKPFIIKEEPKISKPAQKLSVKERFNIDCEDCEKLVKFLDKRLTDAQIQQHLDKCKRHNNPEIIRQNTPKDFWNPFILSFQADDPRNEVLIDERFKEKNN